MAPGRGEGLGQAAALSEGAAEGFVDAPVFATMRLLAYSNKIEIDAGMATLRQPLGQECSRGLEVLVPYVVRCGVPKHPQFGDFLWGGEPRFVVDSRLGIRSQEWAHPKTPPLIVRTRVFTGNVADCAFIRAPAACAHPSLNRTSSNDTAATCQAVPSCSARFRPRTAFFTC